MSLSPKQGAHAAQIKLSKQSGSGIALFDVGSGRLVSSSLKQKMTMQVTVGEQVLEQLVDQTIELKLATTRRLE